MWVLQGQARDHAGSCGVPRMECSVFPSAAWVTRWWFSSPEAGCGASRLSVSTPCAHSGVVLKKHVGVEVEKRVGVLDV